MSPSSLAPGYRLDRYELLCALARGGMAEVWFARLLGKHGFEKHFAVKTILPAYASDPSFQSMFLDEARIAASIVHPNVVQILDLGEQDGVLYIVMDWVEGDSLQQLYRIVTRQGGRIPTGILLRLMCDICAGLQVSHDLRDKEGTHLGVVHRDVSPPNILLTLSTGVAKLIDFGVAKARDRLAGETSVGLMKGKVEFMAPEQALGGEVDQRVDIWAVGAILFKLLTGAPPYRADSQLSMLRRLTSGEPCDPLPSTVPEPVAAVIRRALSLRPEDRFTTADETREALERAMVEANLVTTTPMVAAFLAEHFKERVAERKAVINAAIRLADERATNPGTGADGSRSSHSGLRSARTETAPPLVDSGPLRLSLTSASPSRSPLVGRRAQLLAGLVAVALAIGLSALLKRSSSASVALEPSGHTVAAAPLPPPAAPTEALPVSASAPLPLASLRAPEAALAEKVRLAPVVPRAPAKAQAPVPARASPTAGAPEAGMAPAPPAPPPTAQKRPDLGY